MVAQEQFPVVIIGSGLAGLSAATHLAERGIPPLVIEADRLWAGGRLSGGDPESIEHDGKIWTFKPEHGVHALWGGYVNMKRLVKDYTDTVLMPSSGEEWINRWGREVRRIEAGNAIRSRWIPAPFHYLQLLFHPQIWANIQPWDFLSLPGFLASIFMTLMIDPIAEKKAWDGLTMKDFFYLWTPNLRTTFEGLGANLLAAPREEISLTGFIAALRFFTMLRRDSWQLSYLPDDAHTSLIKPLINYIREQEGDLWSGLTATALERTETGWRITVEDSARQGNRALLAEHVILALDAPSASRLLRNSSSTQIRAQKMYFPEGVRNGVVRLWFTKSPRDGAHGGMMTGDFTPDNFFWLHRLYEDYREWHDATGGSAIELHYYEDKLLEQPDRNLVVDAVTEVQRAFPELKGHFLHGTVRRNSKVHTRFRVPTAETLHVQTGWDQLHACGDWVGYDTPALWMERSTVTGIACANAVLIANGVEPHTILSAPPPEMLARVLSSILFAIRWLLSPIVRLASALRRSAVRNKGN